MTIIHAGSAVTVLNAMLTGFGSAIGIEAAISVQVHDSDISHISLQPSVDDTLIKTCLASLNQELPPLDIQIKSALPPERGLKTSSAVSSALMLALNQHLDLNLDEHDLMSLAAQSSINAGVSITGAFDDAYASIYGGVVLTSNTNGSIEMHQNIPSQLLEQEVLLIIPPHKNPKSSLVELLKEGEKKMLHDLPAKIKDGKYHKVMRINTAVYAPIFTDPDLLGNIKSITGIEVYLNGGGPSLFMIAEETKELVRTLNNYLPNYQLVRTKFRDRV